MKKINHMLAVNPITEEEVDQYSRIASELVLSHVDQYTTVFKTPNSFDNFYRGTENNNWTTGFWTGTIWLAYEKNKDEKLSKAATIQVDNFMDRIQKKIDVNHHDMGFLYSPSCVAAYKLMGNETGKDAAVLAADNLMERFHEVGQFFQAWGDIGAADNYRLIIDCLLNMPLLFFASEVTGNTIYREKAEAHIKTAMKNIIREDDSTYHTYYFDPKTGEGLRGVTHQGYRDNSAWARGQAWGIYGAALAYSKLKNPMYMDIFERLTDFFLESLPTDLIPYWDFTFTDGSEEPRDSSASAIAICGMLEMAKYMEEEKAKHYTDMAKRLMKGLVTHVAVTDKTVSDGLLLQSTYAKSSEFNTCPNLGVDECNTWGDYYYMEALARLEGDWNPYW